MVLPANKEADVWKYTAEDAYPQIFFHDCIADRAYFDGRDLVMEFGEDGFWVGENFPGNHFGKLLRTDKAQVRFVDVEKEFITVYVFRTYRLFYKSLFTRRIYVTPDELARKINSGKWKLEFVTEVYDKGQCFFSGHIQWPSKTQEWQMYLICKHIRYFWNRICEDRPW